MNQINNCRSEHPVITQTSHVYGHFTAGLDVQTTAGRKQATVSPKQAENKDAPRQEGENMEWAAARSTAALNTKQE